MTKVTILGNAGGGKSTLSRELSRAKKLPVYQLDKMLWSPEWTAAPRQVFDAQHDAILEKDTWIIDGLASLESIERRLQASDTIVFVDHPLWVHYWWATKRQLKCIVRERSDFAVGCPMLPKSLELIKMIWHVNTSIRPILLNLISKHRGGKKVFHVRSPSELEQFRNEHCAI